MSAFWYGNAEPVAIFLGHFKTRVLICEAGSGAQVNPRESPGKLTVVPNK